MNLKIIPRILIEVGNSKPSTTLMPSTLLAKVQSQGEKEKWNERSRVFSYLFVGKGGRSVLCFEEFSVFVEHSAVGVDFSSFLHVFKYVPVEC